MIQLKRGSLESLTTEDPVLEDGQIALVKSIYNETSDTYTTRLKIGDGQSAFSALPYAVPNPSIYEDTCLNIPTDNEYKISLYGDDIQKTANNRLIINRRYGDVDSYILDTGWVFVKLFEGSFGPNSGTIEVPGILNYTLFYIRCVDRLTCFIASLYDGNLRGVGGYCSESNAWVTTIGLTVNSSEQLSYTGTGSIYVSKTSSIVNIDQIDDSIAEIYGVLPKSEQIAYITS